MDLIPDLIQDLTEALCDLDQLSKDCPKVKVREVFISHLPHQCHWCNAGNTRCILGWAKSCWKEIMLSSGWWPGLLEHMCWILTLNTGANFP